MAITSVIAGTTGAYGATAPSVMAMNGTYTIYSTWNSASQYSNGVAYVGFNGLTWVWTSAVNGGGTLYAANTSGSTIVPTSGWLGSGNPTLAAITTSLAVSYTCTNPTLVNGGSGIGSATFLPISGANATYSSVTQYCNSTNYLLWNSSDWAVSPTVNSIGSGVLFDYFPSASTAFPTTGWQVDMGASPAPTFSTAPATLNGSFFYLF